MTDKDPARRLPAGFVRRPATAACQMTLYRWNLPQYQQDRGKWPDRQTNGRSYAELIAAHGAAQ